MLLRQCYSYTDLDLFYKEGLYNLKDKIRYLRQKLKINSSNHFNSDLDELEYLESYAINKLYP